MVTKKHLKKKKIIRKKLQNTVYLFQPNIQEINASPDSTGTLQKLTFLLMKTTEWSRLLRKRHMSLRPRYWSLNSSSTDSRPTCSLSTCIHRSIKLPGTGPWTTAPPTPGPPAPYPPAYRGVNDVLLLPYFWRNLKFLFHIYYFRALFSHGSGFRILIFLYRIRILYRSG